MYNYSPLKSIHIKNFRNLGDVEIDFDDSPIITLLGENEAGKTSVIKAFSMCALHDSPKDQKDYIRDGQKALAVQIELQDGTKILRYKELSGANLYQVTDKNGEKWQTNKITDGLPVAVSKQMGLTVEPETGEYLNVRTYEDKLLFVVTPASTNYKVMYNALKVEQLTKAIKLGSNEVNALRYEITKNTDSANTLHERLKDIEVLDLEAASSLKESLKAQLVVLEKLEKLNSLVAKYNEIRSKLGALALIDAYKLQPIDEMLASRINNVNRLLKNRSDVDKKLSVYRELNTLDTVDTSIISRLDSIRNKVAELKTKNDRTAILEPVKSLESVSEVAIIRMGKLHEYLNNKRKLDNTLSAYSSLGECQEVNIGTLDKLGKLVKNIAENNDRAVKIGQLTTYMHQVTDYLKASGVAVESCPKCGEAIVIDLDKIS